MSSNRRGRGRAADRAPVEGNNGRGRQGNDPIGAVGGQMQAMNIAGAGARQRNLDFYDLVKTRPGHKESKTGSKGTVVPLVSNYFTFKTKPDFRIFQYRVDFSVEEDRTYVKQAIVYRLKDVLPKNVFDGSIMITTEPIYPHAQQSEKVLVGAIENRAAGTSEPVEVKIRLVGEIHPSDHHYIQFLNVVMRNAMEKLNLVKINRNYFDSGDAKYERRHNLEIWPGYTTSIRQHENAILMCAEVSTKILRNDSVYDQIRVLKERKFGNEAIRRALIGTIVITRYNKKTYRIDDVDFASNPITTQFSYKKQNINLADYFQMKYNMRCSDLTQDILVSMPRERDIRRGQKGPFALIPEFCTMTGQDDQMRNNFNLQRDLAKYTNMDPPIRIRRLEDLSKRLTSNDDSMKALSAWNMKMDPKMIEVKGRLIDPVNVFVDQNNKRAMYKQNEPDWSGGLRDSLYLPAEIKRWVFIYPKTEERKVYGFWNAMLQYGGKLTNITEPNWKVLPDTAITTYLATLRQSIKKGPRMIFVVLPTKTGVTYSEIKKLLCVENPVPSQVITASKLPNENERKMSTMVTKIVIQMVAKLGGQPWAIKMPFPKGCMVVGFDTYHDTTARGKSFGALVASYNPNCTKYFSALSEHAPRAELSDQIPALFSRAFNHYKEKNGEFPNRVFFYRDGVGDGQVAQVYGHELERIKDIINNATGLENCKLAFIIVSKRINTKFFKKTNGGVAGNPMPGTVVDDIVTLPNRYDFFLISQSVRNGTVNPTSYNVIYDDSNLPPDRMQQFTYMLCHLYYNLTGTTRVPAPCQYAHKLAYLAGESLHCPVSRHLEDLLYFL